MRTETTEEICKPKKLPQYLATLSVCLGAISTGTVSGWTGNISEDIKTQSFNGIDIDEEALGWISSITTLAMIIFCIPGAILSNWIGRKSVLLILIIPFMTGWLLIIFSSSLWMIYFGRFLTGTACASFVVCAPLYISEISEKEIRGALCSYIELHYIIGTFLAKLVSLVLDMIPYTIVMSVIPIIFGITFIFQPESPVYHVKRGHDKNARKVIGRLRGKSYNVEKELDIIKSNLNCNITISKQSIISSLKKKGTQKAMFVCFAMCIFHQLVGVSAVNSYTASIFKSTGVGFNEKISSLIVGFCQLLAIFLESLTIDKVGRRALLIISSLGGGVSVGALAVFFTLKDRNILAEDDISKIAFLPVVALSLYMFTYSIGMGPIPIILVAELLPPEVKTVCMGIGSFLSLTSVFVIIKFYFDLRTAIGADGTFYMFAIISLLVAVFAYCFVPETKGKSFAEIQRELNE